MSDGQDYYTALKTVGNQVTYQMYNGTTHELFDSRTPTPMPVSFSWTNGFPSAHGTRWRRIVRLAASCAPALRRMMRP